MKYTTDQRLEFERILNEQLDANNGVLYHDDYESKLAEFLEEEHESGRLSGLIPDLARAVKTLTVKRREWDIPSGQQQFDLYQREALLSQGNGTDVQMAKSTAEHLSTHLTVLTENFTAVQTKFLIKKNALDVWIPRCFKRGCTLEELMESE